MRHHVDEVTGIVKNRVENELLKRQSNLSSLHQSVEKLAQSSKMFAEVCVILSLA